MLKKIKYFYRNWVRINKKFFVKGYQDFLYQKKSNVQYNQSLLQTLHLGYSPVFVLSTGRSGTKFLSNILMKIPQVDVYHKPKPELIYYSKYAYENFQTKSEIIEKIFDAARLELIQESFLRDRIFVETNNRITFFAYAIPKLYPQAKFIHLIRHPADFVRSGMRRNWYVQKDDVHNIGRIRPTNEFNLSPFEKICWLWNETNKFIEAFKAANFKSSNIITVKAEDLFKSYEQVEQLLAFIGIEKIDKKALKKTINKPANIQKSGTFPPYLNWDIKQKQILKKYCHHLMAEYSYHV